MSSLAVNLTFRNADFPNGITTTKSESCLAYSKINISIIASLIGTCEVQFSTLLGGTFTTFYNFNIGTSDKYNSVSVRGAYVRYKFTNSTGGDGKISVNTIITNDGGADNIHNTNIVKSDYSSALVRQHSDYFTDAIMNMYEGIIIKEFHGMAYELNNTNKRNFWDFDVNLAPVVTTNKDLYVVSSSVADSAVGAGMRTGTAEYMYIDASGDIKRAIQSFNMNGTARASLGVSGIAITNAEITSAGGTNNSGNITFEADMGGGSFTKLNVMPTTLGQTKLFIGFPQTGENLVITDATYSGSGQFIAFIDLTVVKISNGVKKVVHQGVNDLANHSGKLHTAILVRGGIEYIIGEIRAHTAPPTTDNFFNLHATGTFKDLTFQI